MRKKREIRRKEDKRIQKENEFVQDQDVQEEEIRGTGTRKRGRKVRLVEGHLGF
jgi:hypothetical protein